MTLEELKTFKRYEPETWLGGLINMKENKNGLYIRYSELREFFMNQQSDVKMNKVICLREGTANRGIKFEAIQFTKEILDEFLLRNTQTDPSKIRPYNSPFYFKKEYENFKGAYRFINLMYPNDWLVFNPTETEELHILSCYSNESFEHLFRIVSESTEIKHRTNEYTTKVQTVEAYQVTEETFHRSNIIKDNYVVIFDQEFYCDVSYKHVYDGPRRMLGTPVATINEWIVKKSNGEFKVYSDKKFRKKFEL